MCGLIIYREFLGTEQLKQQSKLLSLVHNTVKKK